jgi:outer membrane receptor for ferrienterochelin and colicins
MSLNKNNIVAFLYLFFSVSGFSQQKKPNDSLRTETLEEVVVTATRTLRQLSSLPMPVQIVSKLDIKQSNSLRLSDILNEQTGLITVPDFGGGEGIQMQGLDSQYTLILIDGVPLIGRSAGTLDLNRITVGNIKQIEIVKGASSSLYGSEALGGVINIITETPKYGFKGATNYRAGAFGTHDVSASISTRKERLGITAFMNRFSSSGYDLIAGDDLNTVEPYSNYTFDTKVTYEFSESTDLIFSGRYYTQHQDNVASASLRGESEINEWNTRLKVTHKHSDTWTSLIELYATRYIAEEFLNDTDGSAFSENSFNQFFARPEFRSTLHIKEKSELTLGLGTTHESLERTSFSTNPVFNSPYIFVQYDYHPTEKWNFIFGARYDDHSDYQSQFSPKFAINYKINDRISLKGSVGYGFKAPDFRQLYFDFTNATVGYTVLGYNAVQTALPLLEAQGQLANIVVSLSEFQDALRPESSVSINFGTRYKITSKLTASLNFFRNNIDNLIDTRVIANKTNGQNVFSYYNVNEVYTQGLEFDSQWKPNHRWRISAGYQLLYAKDREAERAFEEGRVFARLTPTSPSFQLQKNDYFGLFNRSRHMANLKVFYTIPKWNMDANIRTTYRSKYGLFDSNSNSYLDDFDVFVEGYAVVDLALNKTVYQNYQLGVGLDNAFNFTDAQNISNIAGRILYGKLNIQF